MRYCCISATALAAIAGASVSVCLTCLSLSPSPLVLFQTYPILAIIGGAGCLVIFQGARMLTSHPDITMRKGERGAFIRDNDEEAEEFHKHPLRQYARKGNTQIMGGLNSAMVGGKVREDRE